MRKFLTLSLASILLVVFGVSDLYAKGRKGSRRVGGINSHGKRSHYIGGRK